LNEKSGGSSTQFLIHFGLKRQLNQLAFHSVDIGEITASSCSMHEFLTLRDDIRSTDIHVKQPSSTRMSGQKYHNFAGQCNKRRLGNVTYFDLQDIQMNECQMDALFGE